MSGFGVVADDGGVRRVCWRTADGPIDLGRLAEADRPELAPYLTGGTLDPLLAAGPAVWGEVLAAAQGWERRGAEPLSGTPVLGFTVADYVDFYASEHHATNVGHLFRPGQPALPKSWKHLPIGYHGRAGTVVVSGTPIRRPHGLRRSVSEGGNETVGFGPCQRLDYEAELGFVVGVPSEQGRPVPRTAFADHVFGVCLVNDWSARDIQAFETVPLGPFLGKSFATSVSPWLVPLALLQVARIAPPHRDPVPAAYLDDTEDAEPWGLDLSFEIRINGARISAPPAATLYWTGAQQMAHLTVNGASLRTGDLYASGTISGPTDAELGSLLEASRNGTVPVPVGESTRTFLEDGDRVSISATAPGAEGPIDLGEVVGTVVP